MVNKAHGKWLCAAADTHFHVWGAFLHYVLSWYFTVSLYNTFSHSSKSSTNICFRSLTAEEKLGFVSGVLFSV